MPALRPLTPPRKAPTTLRRATTNDQIATIDRRGSNAAGLLRSMLSGPIARSTLARRTGLSAAAVTRLVQDLTVRRLVRELPVRSPQPGLGRPHQPVDLDDRYWMAAGLHIAVPCSTVALTDLRGRVLAKEVLPHEDAPPAVVLARAADRLSTLLRAHDDRGLLGVGLAGGGRVDHLSGDIVTHNLLGWRDVPAGRIVAERLDAPVLVANHAHALARAELLFGAVRDRARRSAVTLFVGNMIDAALSTAGVVHHGPGSTAGEIAHLPLGDPGDRCVCGRWGCLQASVSDRAMGERAAAVGITSVASYDGLVAAARRGDERAVDLFRERLRRVGRAASVLLDVVNPDVLAVVEGGLNLVPSIAPLLMAELRAEVSATSQVCTAPDEVVVAGSFGADVLAVAGVATVLDSVFTRPLDLPARTAASA